MKIDNSNEVSLTNSEYSFSTFNGIDDYNAKNKNWDLMTNLLKITSPDLAQKIFICNFDVTDSIRNGVNTMKIYLYTANTGTGAKFLFCGDPPALSTPSVNHCKIITNFPTSNELVGGTFSNPGFDLNIIQIKRNTSDSTKVDIKINEGTEVQLSIFKIH